MTVCGVKTDGALLIFFKRIYWVKSFSRKDCSPFVWIVWSVVWIVWKWSFFNYYQWILLVNSELRFLMLELILFIGLFGMFYVLWMIGWMRRGDDKLLSVFSVRVLLGWDRIGIKRGSFPSEIHNMEGLFIRRLLCVIPSPNLQRDWLFEAIGFLFRPRCRVIGFESFFNGISEERIFLGSYSLHVYIYFTFKNKFILIKYILIILRLVFHLATIFFTIKKRLNPVANP